MTLKSAENLTIIRENLLSDLEESNQMVLNQKVSIQWFPGSRGETSLWCSCNVSAITLKVVLQISDFALISSS